MIAFSEKREDVIVTDDTEHIQDWIEEHDGKPAISGEGDELGVIFEGEESEQNLKEISWDEFFKILDQKDLSFAYTNSDSIRLNSQKFQFRNRTQANTEMEENEVFGNTLESNDDAEKRNLG